MTQSAMGTHGSNVSTSVHGPSATDAKDGSRAHGAPPRVLQPRVLPPRVPQPPGARFMFHVKRQSPALVITTAYGSLAMGALRSTGLAQEPNDTGH